MAQPMTYPRKQVNDILISLYLADGLPKEKAIATAASKLNAAVARVQPLVKGAQDIAGWRSACANLHAWLHPSQ